MKVFKYEDIPNVSDVCDGLEFIADETIFTTCSDPECHAVHLIMREKGGPYVVAASFSADMIRNMLTCVEMIIAHKQKTTEH